MTVEKSVEETLSSDQSDNTVKPNVDDPIQQLVVASCRSGQDVIVQVDADSDMVAALSVSVLPRVDKKLDHVQVLVVAPTRVLVEEIQKKMSAVGKLLACKVTGKENVRVYACIGGSSARKGRLELEKGNFQVVVGTPSRLTDMIKRKALHIDKVGTFVVPDADVLFFGGFKKEVFNIFNMLPKDVQVILFATLMPAYCHRLNLNFSGNEDLLLASDAMNVTKAAAAAKNAAGDASPKEIKTKNKVEGDTHKEDKKENLSGTEREAPVKSVKKEASSKKKAVKVSTRQPVVAVLSDKTAFCTPWTDVKIASNHVFKFPTAKPKKRPVWKSFFTFHLRTVKPLHFRLHYFDLRFRGETARLIFAYRKVKYEDVRISKEEWASKEATFNYRQLPVLEIDGKPLSESFAINRYLGCLYGLGGKTPLEAAFLDQTAEQFRSFYEALQPYVHAKLKYVPGDVAKLRETAYLPAVEKYLPWIESALKSSSSGFFGPSGLSWVDFYVTTFLEGLIAIEEDTLAKFPALQALLKKVNSIPQLQKYYAKRAPSPL